MIAIAVLSIGAVGLLAALSFSLFSAEHGARLSFASAYNRKVLELIQSNSVTWSDVSTVTVPGNVTDASNDPDWRPLASGVLAQSTGGDLPRLWGVTDADAEAWAKQASEFQTNIAIAREVASWSTESNVHNKYKNLLARVTITTRWRTRGVWRSVRTTGVHIVPASTT